MLMSLDPGIGILGLIITVNLAMTVGNGWQIHRIRDGEAERTDRYVAALLHKEGHYAAAKALREDKDDPEAPVHPLKRPRQIGMTPR